MKEKVAKPEQVLIIKPCDELKFEGRLTEPAASYLRLTNPSEKKVVFKIQTTAPKNYFVRPNSGVLKPNGAIDVEISVQPFFFVPKEVRKHKFMVQSLYAPDGPDDELSFDEVWGNKTSEQVMDSRMRCTFEVTAAKHKRHCTIL